MLHRYLLCLAALLFLVPSLPAQVVPETPATLADGSYYLPRGTRYNPAIPTPASYYGFGIGEWHLSHDQLVGYMRALAAAAPDRVKLQVYGHTHQRRPMMIVTITAPENHTRLADVQRQHLANLDPQAPAPPADLPSVVWLGYSVHGNEASGANAVSLVAYHLAAAQGGEVEAWLRNAVILLDPSLNPDGMQRFSTWVNNYKSIHHPSASSADREHNEEWPGGRFNHYWFDSNREWLAAQQPEGQGRLAVFHQWRPLIFTDHHEMGAGSTFFFQPGIPSGNHPLTPVANQALTERIARYHARALDSVRALYFTKEQYDDFYAGKGSSYPDLNGSIGILFEQASSRGHRQQTDNGLLTFPFTIRNQVLTSFSTIRAAVGLRADLRSYQRQFAVDAARAAAADTTRYLLLHDPHGRGNAQALAEVLLRHRIEVRTLAKPMGRFTPAQSIVVPMQQPQYLLLKALTERRTQFTDSIFYDISAWTLPMAFGLRAESRRSLPPDAVGPVYALMSNPTTALDTTAYAYAVDPRQPHFHRALGWLLRHGVMVRAATVPIQLPSGQMLPHGALLIPRQTIQPQPNLTDVLRRAVTETGVQLTPLATGWVTQGVNPGSPLTTVLQPVRAGLVVGQGVSPTDAGEIWHYFDQTLQHPLTLLTLRGGFWNGLDDHNVILLADGSYPTLTDSERDRLRGWLSQGNTLVAMGGGAVRWLNDQRIAPARTWSLPADSLNRIQRSFETYQRTQRSRSVPGTILRARLDISHPLGFGFAEASIPVFRDNGFVLERHKSPFGNPLVYEANPLGAGFLPPGIAAKLPGSAAVTVTGVGSGRVVQVMDNWVFRSFWYGTKPLLGNAVFFGQLINPATGRTGAD